MQQSAIVFHVNASPDYDQGYGLGCYNSGWPDTISETKRIEKRSESYLDGYCDGYTECSTGHEIMQQPDSEDSQPSEETQSSQPSQSGGMDWIKTCNDLQMALVSSCDVLVNPDNTLTAEGERAVGCIRNGIALAGGGTLLLSLPLPLVIAALQVLEEPTGCGGIAEWGLIGETGDLRGMISRLT